MARTIRTAPITPRDRDVRTRRRAVTRLDSLRVELREQDVLV